MRRLISPQSRRDLVASGFAIVVFCGLACPMVLQIIVLVTVDRILFYSSDTFQRAVIAITAVSVVSALCACIGFARINRGLP